VIRYYVNQISNLWIIRSAIEDPPGSGTFVNLYTNTNVGNVGVGIQDPNEKMEFSSGFRVTSGIIANDICDGGSTDCMPVKTITGTEPAMDCQDSSKAVRRIENNAVGCDPIFSNHVTFNCPAGEHATGISNAGKLICSP